MPPAVSRNNCSSVVWKRDLEELRGRLTSTASVITVRGNLFAVRKTEKSRLFRLRHLRCHSVARTNVARFSFEPQLVNAGLSLRDIWYRDVVDPHGGDVTKERVRHLDVDVLGNCCWLVLIHPHVVDRSFDVGLSQIIIAGNSDRVRRRRHRRRRCRLSELPMIVGYVGHSHTLRGVVVEHPIG